LDINKSDIFYNYHISFNFNSDERISMVSIALQVYGFHSIRHHCSI